MHGENLKLSLFDVTQSNVDTILPPTRVSSFKLSTGR